MAKEKNYKCTECETKYTKWFGQCTHCKSWNSILEISNQKETINSDRPINVPNNAIYKTCFSRFNSIFGGGLAQKGLYLIGGEPGIGKSTFLTQILNSLSQKLDVIYFSGEESVDQVKNRFKRLASNTDHIMISNERNLNQIKNDISTNKPQVIIIDSLQTLKNNSVFNQEGSLKDYKNNIFDLNEFVSNNNLLCFCVSHITKNGSFTGPKTIEHMVDVSLVLQGEGDEIVIKVLKNRFGENKISVNYTMTDTGMIELKKSYSVTSFFKNTEDLPIVSIDCDLDRFYIREIQSLVIAKAQLTSRHLINSYSRNKLNLLLAVLEKKLKIPFHTMDVYCDIINTKQCYSNYIDLGLAAALICSYYDIKLDQKYIFFGEVDLTSRIRVSSKSQKLLAKLEIDKDTYVITSKDVTISGNQIKKINNCIDLKNLLIGDLNEQKAS